jgi:hypothetical protein
MSSDNNATWGVFNPAKQIDVWYQLPTFSVVVAPINQDGTLGGFTTATGVLPGYTDAGSTAAWWPGVMPVMRVYPDKFPALDSADYPQGGVLVSGLVSEPAPPASNPSAVYGWITRNAGVICSGGACKAAYSIFPDPSVNLLMSAAEYGLDNFTGDISSCVLDPTTCTTTPADCYVPALYWNQVSGASWSCKNGGYQSYSETCTAEMDWQKAENRIVSCQPSPGGSGATSCEQTKNLQWPPANSAIAAPDPGKNNHNVDVTNLTYVPNYCVLQQNNFSQGLLTIGTWNYGYLAYYAPTQGNTNTEQLLSDFPPNCTGNTCDGQVGNINALIADWFGNTLFQTGAQGLYVTNVLTGNIAKGTEVTLIPQAVDSPSGSGGWKSDLSEAESIAKATVSVISTASDFVASPVDPEAAQSPTFLASGSALEIPLGGAQYRAQFMWTEQQLASLGLRPGATLRGINFRNVPGYSERPVSDLFFPTVTLELSEAAVEAGEDLSSDYWSNFGSNPVMVRDSALRLEPGRFPSNSVYPNLTTELPPRGAARGRPIPFEQPYHYEGGTLLLSIRSSGSSDSNPLLIEAMRTSAAQGVYELVQPPPKPLPTLLNFVPAVEFLQD